MDGWFKSTVERSDATFRILISPTPIVGPDRVTKNDNHANAGFKHEGDLIRKFIARQKNMYVICGDRHWQYISKHPETGVIEFSCGLSRSIHPFLSPCFPDGIHLFPCSPGSYPLCYP